MSLNLVVAVSADWGIGRDNGLLFRIPADLARFRELTLGGTVIMGRGTFKSLPGQRPLPGRRNIVLSRQPGLAIPGADVAGSKEEALAAIAAGGPVFVIGGESVYRLFLDDCARAYVTKVDASAPADRFFPDLDREEGWRRAGQSGEFTENGLSYSYVEYENPRAMKMKAMGTKPAAAPPYCASGSPR